MGLAVIATFAVSLWITLYALGVKSFDGALLALIIVIVGAGLRIYGPRGAADPRD